MVRVVGTGDKRYWIEQVFRTLKHLLATEACQVRSENAYYGHLVLRLMACLVLFYTSRVCYKGKVTTDEIVFNLKHHWSSVNCEALDLYGLSEGVEREPALMLAYSVERKSQMLCQSWASKPGGPSVPRP